MKVQSPHRVHIRWMTRRDLAEVCDIELRSFDYYWTESDFLKVQRNRNCIGMVAEVKPTPASEPYVVGYMVYEITKAIIHLTHHG